MARSEKENTFKHSYKETRRDNTGLGVYNSGLQKCSPGYSWGPAVRDHYLLHYVSGGKGAYECQGRIWKLGAGDLFLSYPDTVISYRADHGEPWEYYWVGFHGADTAWLLEHTAFSRERPVQRFDPPEPMLERLLVDIYEARGMDAAGDAAMTGRLYLLLSYIMRMFPTQATPSSQGRTYFEQAVRIISQSMAQGIGVQEIADSVGLSRSQLYRVFVQECGMAPVEFLNQYRVTRAAALLREQELTVAQVAASVGYTDPLYFSRVFKKTKGVSPGAYQRKKRKGS